MIKTDSSSLKKTKIGGQALIEGVMMRGVSTGAMAVRKPDGEIYTEQWKIPEKKWYNKAPFIRGSVNFVKMLADGFKYIMKSAEIGTDEEEEEPTKFDRQIVKLFGEKGAEAVFKALAVILMVLMYAAMIGAFFFLPSFLFSLMEKAAASDISMWKAAFEGVLKLVLFVVYMAITARFPSMKRLYAYHGAEHKTIACYEHGLELNVENVRKMKRFHPRCGTSFIIITLLVSIIVYSLIPIRPAEWWGIENSALEALVRIILKLPALPVVIGAAYELIQLAGRYTNPVTTALSAPGLLMQRITTNEPDDTMIEVAIMAMTPCLPKEGEDDNW